MATESNGDTSPSRRKKILIAAGYTVAGLWIFGGSLFFYLRFTAVFYFDNEAAINDAIVRLWEILGLH